MDRYLSHHRPVVDRQSDQVIAWVVRVTLRAEGTEAFDDIRFVVDRSASARHWTRAEVDLLVTMALRPIDEGWTPSTPVLAHYARLLQEFNHRARYETLERFQFSEDT